MTLCAVRERLGGRDDTGNAILEFVVLSAFLMVPLVYIVLAVFRVQGSAYGITEAAREAGRAYVEADTFSAAAGQACTAATVALQDQIGGMFDCARQMTITCPAQSDSACVDLAPGEIVHVEIHLTVNLPLLPTSVFGRRLGVPVSSAHDEVVDAFRAAR